MSSHRSLRVAEAIREVVASAILFEVSDPRVQGVTVLRVKVAHDLRSAVIFVAIAGSESDQNRSMKGLRSACGFLQAKVAARLQTRFTPVLSFKLDEGVRKSVEISRLIDEAVASDRKPGDAPEDGGEDDDIDFGDDEDQPADDEAADDDSQN